VDDIHQDIDVAFRKIVLEKITALKRKPTVFIAASPGSLHDVRRSPLVVVPPLSSAGYRRQIHWLKQPPDLRATQRAIRQKLMLAICSAHGRRQRLGPRAARGHPRELFA
jgi:hypothetical protein